MMMVNNEDVLKFHAVCEQFSKEEMDRMSDKQLVSVLSTAFATSKAALMRLNRKRPALKGVPTKEKDAWLNGFTNAIDAVIMQLAEELNMELNEWKI